MKCSDALLVFGSHFVSTLKENCLKTYPSLKKIHFMHKKILFLVFFRSKEGEREGMTMLTNCRTWQNGRNDRTSVSIFSSLYIEIDESCCLVPSTDQSHTSMECLVYFRMLAIFIVFSRFVIANGNPGHPYKDKCHE